MVAFIQRGSCNFTKNKLSKLDSAMNRDFLFSGLNLNIIVQKKCARKMHNIWIRGSCNFTKNKLSKLDNSMNRDFLFSGLNLNIIVQKKCARKMHNIWINALKICGIKYSNIETRSLFTLC